MKSFGVGFKKNNKVLALNVDPTITSKSTSPGNSVPPSPKSQGGTPKGSASKSGRFSPQPPPKVPGSTPKGVKKGISSQPSPQPTISSSAPSPVPKVHNETPQTKALAGSIGVSILRPEDLKKSVVVRSGTGTPVSANVGGEGGRPDGKTTPVPQSGDGTPTLDQGDRRESFRKRRTMDRPTGNAATEERMKR